MVGVGTFTRRGTFHKERSVHKERNEERVTEFVKKVTTGELGSVDAILREHQYPRWVM